MITVHNFIPYRLKRSHIFLMFGVLLVFLFGQLSLAADLPRMKRADSFLGIHFDFHAGEDCNRVGRRTTVEMVELVIDKVRP
ncbi:MAG: hypothetical protein ACYS67_18155, partial [Planctomycetota bacterium]